MRRGDAAATVPPGGLYSPSPSGVSSGLTGGQWGRRADVRCRPATVCHPSFTLAHSTAHHPQTRPRSRRSPRRMRHALHPAPPHQPSWRTSTPHGTHRDQPRRTRPRMRDAAGEDGSGWPHLAARGWGSDTRGVTAATLLPRLIAATTCGGGRSGGADRGGAGGGGGTAAATRAHTTTTLRRDGRRGCHRRPGDQWTLGTRGRAALLPLHRHSSGRWEGLQPVLRPQRGATQTAGTSLQETASIASVSCSPPVITKKPPKVIATASTSTSGDCWPPRLSRQRACAVLCHQGAQLRGLVGPCLPTVCQATFRQVTS